MMNEDFEHVHGHGPHEIDQSELDEQKREIAELSRNGYQYLKEGWLEKADRCFEEILKVQPDNNYALVGMGDSLRRRKNCKQAIVYYQRCLESHPDNNYALFGLADCYRSMKFFNRAIEVWEEYLKHDDENVTVLTRVADAHRKARSFDRSKALYDRVLEIEHDNAYALIGLGHLYYDFRKHREALGYWLHMREISGDKVDIRVLTSIGNCYRKLKEFENGEAFFLEALERERANFYALFGLADCYRGMNEPAKSLECWNRILERDANNKVILTRAGDAYRALGNLNMAEIYYKRALNIEYDLYAVIGLALIAKEAGRYEDAAESLKSIIPSDTKNHRLYVDTAECELALGRKQDAIATLRQFTKLGIRNRSVNDMLSRLTQEKP